MYVHRLGEGHGKVAKYNCTGYFDVGENTYELATSTVVICSKCICSCKILLCIPVNILI